MANSVWWVIIFFRGMQLAVSQYPYKQKVNPQSKGWPKPKCPKPWPIVIPVPQAWAVPINTPACLPGLFSFDDHWHLCFIGLPFCCMTEGAFQLGRLRASKVAAELYPRGL